MHQFKSSKTISAGPESVNDDDSEPEETGDLLQGAVLL